MSKRVLSDSEFRRALTREMGESPPPADGWLALMAENGYTDAEVATILVAADVKGQAEVVKAVRALR